MLGTVIECQARVNVAEAARLVVIAQDVWDVLLELMRAWGVSQAELAGWVVAGARVAPSVVLVPALGLGVASTAVRAAFAVVLAAAVVPALGPAAVEGGLPRAVLSALAAGVPVALVTSAGLWAAWMAGGLVDQLALPGQAPPSRFGTLLGLLASIGFLQMGGAAQIAERLVSAPVGVEPLRLAAYAVARGIEMAALMAVPVLLLVVLVNVVGLFVMRADPRGAVSSIFDLCRPLLVVGGVAVLLERVAELVLVLRP